MREITDRTWNVVNRLPVSQAKVIFNNIEGLKRFCKTHEDVQDLRELLPLLLDDDPQEIVAAHYAAIEIVSSPDAKVLPFNLE